MANGNIQKKHELREKMRGNSFLWASLFFVLASLAAHVQMLRTVFVVKIVSVDEVEKDAPIVGQGTTLKNETFSKKLSSDIISKMLREGTIDRGGSTVKKVKLSEKLLDRFIIVPEYRLMFCYVEKVGCSMFNHLFRMLRIMHPAVNASEAKFQASNLWFRNSPKHHGLKKEDLENLLVNSSWTKAVFYRDPASRFASAYKSKCEGWDRDGRMNCEYVFGSKNVTFSEAVLYPNQKRLFGNPHWTPLSWFCGNLGNTLEMYDFVAELTHETSSFHVTRLLRQVGVDAEFTKILAQNIVTTGGTNMAADLSLIQARWKGIQFQRASINEDHNSWNRQQRRQTTIHLNESIRQTLRDKYESDYLLFGMQQKGEGSLRTATSRPGT